MEVDFSERVLEIVERVPPGRVVTFGLIADAIGHGGARQVGRVMSLEGAAVTWWRVVRVNGTLPPHLMTDAQQHWQEEGTPVRRGRVDVPSAVWSPGDSRPSVAEQPRGTSGLRTAACPGR